MNQTLYDQDIEKGVMRYSEDGARATSIRNMHRWLIFVCLNRKKSYKR
jgi:hypothetical protein